MKGLLIVVGLVGTTWGQESVVVQTTQGPVVGRRDPQGGVYNFLNIPYATAPTGPNKFKAPLPPPNWTEPYDKADIIIGCMQPSSNRFRRPPGFSMAEDCLLANIHIPDTNETNLPVLVAVHGGAYHFWFGAGIQMNSLVRTRHIIVVTFNYRVSLPGFLCLGTEDIPGNAGMKDQVALLRWVNRNIANFGGNPDDVTITGCSSGGGSVDFLTLSPMARGLYKKAIMESGAALGSVGAQIDPVENAKYYAKLLNFNNVDDITALEEFYKTVSYEVLLSKFDAIWDREDSLFLFTPCVEGNTTEEKFIDDAPWNYLVNGVYDKVPLLYGFTEMEGLLRMPEFDSYRDKMNENFANFLPAELQFENEAQKEEVAARVKSFYFGDRAVSEETILSYVYYFTDVMFVYPMIRAANMRAWNGDTIYLYKYSFVDENTPFVPHTTVRGVGHCEQFMIIVDNSISTNHSEEFETMRENVRKLWLNFIISGNPTPEGSLPSWAPMREYAAPYMSLNQTLELRQTGLLEPRADFWDAIYDDHYRAPAPPAAPERAHDATGPVLLITVLTYLVFAP